MSSSFRRDPRVKSFSLDKVTFARDNREESIPVVNLSASGIALFIKNLYSFQLTDEVLRGRLYSEEKSFALMLQVVRRDNSIAGCRILSDTSDIEKYMRRRFSVELSALSLVEVSKEILAKPDDGNPHWFFNGLNNELYLVEYDNKPVRYRVNCRGHEISAEQGRAPRHYIDNVESAADERVLAEMTEFLRHIEGLPESIRNSLLDDISQLKSP